MTTKRKGQPPKERKKKSHGIRMYDDDHALAIKEHGSLQKFVDWATGEMRDDLNFSVCPECLNVKSLPLFMQGLQAAQCGQEDEIRPFRCA